MFRVRATRDIELPLRPVLAALLLAEVAGSAVELDELVSAPIATAAVGKLLGLSPRTALEVADVGRDGRTPGVGRHEPDAQPRRGVVPLGHSSVERGPSGLR